MKKILIFLFIAVSALTTKAQTINWMSFEEALEMQKKKPKKIFMDVYTDWCGPCKMLDKNTFGNAEVAKFINDNYYAVKFNAEGKDKVSYKDKEYSNPGYTEGRSGRNSTHQLSRALGVTAYPTMIFFDEKGEIIQQIKGYYKPSQLEIYLKVFASDDYKKFNNQEEWTKYQSNFKGKFVDN